MWLTHNELKMAKSNHKFKIWNDLISDMCSMDNYLCEMTNEEIETWDRMVTLTNKKQREEAKKIKNLIGE